MIENTHILWLLVLLLEGCQIWMVFGFQLRITGKTIEIFTHFWMYLPFHSKLFQFLLWPRKVFFHLIFLPLFLFQPKLDALWNLLRIRMVMTAMRWRWRVKVLGDATLGPTPKDRWRRCSFHVCQSSGYWLRSTRWWWLLCSSGPF